MSRIILNSLIDRNKIMFSAGRDCNKNDYEDIDLKELLPSYTICSIKDGRCLGLPIILEFNSSGIEVASKFVTKQSWISKKECLQLIRDLIGNLIYNKLMDSSKML